MYKAEIYFILIYVIISNITHVHYIIIFDSDQSYSNVLDTIKKILISAIINFILVMSFYISTCTRAKNILHGLMYIIFSNNAHVHCYITEPYNSRYHHTLCLECFRYDERNTHLCNNCNLLCSLKKPCKEKIISLLIIYT